MPKHTKKISSKKNQSRTNTLPMAALLMALGVSSLTYTVTVSANDTATASRYVGMHMQKNKKGEGERHSRASSTEHVKPAASGVIQSVQGYVVTVKSRDDVFYTIDVSKATMLRGGRGQASTTVSVTDLKVGDMFGAKGILTGTHVIATQAMTSPQHPFMRKLHNVLDTIK